MWWNNQNFNKKIPSNQGKELCFKVWHGFVNKVYEQKIFFWTEDKEILGVMELKEGQTLEITKLNEKMNKLATSSSFRQKYLQALNFPLETYYF